MTGSYICRRCIVIKLYQLSTINHQPLAINHYPSTITTPTPYKNLRIVFMGTPEFAVASLEALLNAGCNIAGVVTAPDKPAGRGMKLQESAVKKFALQHGLTILQPNKLKDPEFLNHLAGLKADIQVVVAFRMLPVPVWNMPPLGTINVHGSLLPQYRGAAPINWAIINGEKETGVTTFKLQHEIDTGNILLQEKLAIGENENAGELHDRMKITGAHLLVETIKKIADGTIREVPQSQFAPGEIKHAPKIFTDTCRIDWSGSVDEIYNLIRGLSPFPGAFTLFNQKVLKIYRCEKEITQPLNPIGSFETDKKTYLKMAASDGYLSIKELQMEGKKKMNVMEFLRGYRFE